jgi:hypothetical protein
MLALASLLVAMEANLFAILFASIPLSMKDLQVSK